MASAETCKAVIERRVLRDWNLGAKPRPRNAVILVIGAQKIVRDLDEALRRIEEHCLPLEDQRALRAYGQHSAINKLLVLNKETPGRIHVILVQAALGY